MRINHRLTITIKTKSTMNQNRAPYRFPTSSLRTMSNNDNINKIPLAALVSLLSKFNVQISDILISDYEECMVTYLECRPLAHQNSSNPCQHSRDEPGLSLSRFLRGHRQLVTALNYIPTFFDGDLESPWASLTPTAIAPSGNAQSSGSSDSLVSPADIASPNPEGSSTAPADSAGFTCAQCGAQNILPGPVTAWYAVTAGTTVGVFRGWWVISVVPPSRPRLKSL
jgi:hypothetical protein